MRLLKRYVQNCDTLEDLEMNVISKLNQGEELANAIVLQAVKDYRDAVKKLSRGRRNDAAQQTRDECLRFFRSVWFTQLTAIEPELLIKKLDEEAGT